jgi:hypothetical protein
LPFTTSTYVLHVIETRDVVRTEYRRLGSGCERAVLQPPPRSEDVTTSRDPTDAPGADLIVAEDIGDDSVFDAVVETLDVVGADVRSERSMLGALPPWYGGRTTLSPREIRSASSGANAGVVRVVRVV